MSSHMVLMYGTAPWPENPRPATPFVPVPPDPEMPFIPAPAPEPISGHPGANIDGRVREPVSLITRAEFQSAIESLRGALREVESLLANRTELALELSRVSRENRRLRRKCNRLARAVKQK